MNFTIHPYDLEEIGRNAHGRITCKIQGYWSSDPITLYIDRHGYGASQGWKVTMSHSSGGRDTKEVTCDMQAAMNFADAMRELAIIGRDLILTYGDTLESFNQQERTARIAQDEAEKAALAAKVEADPAMGVVAATDIVGVMAGGALKIVRFYVRGSDERSVTVSVARREKTKFYVGGATTAKKEVIALLAKLSTREDLSVRS